MRDSALKRVLVSAWFSWLELKRGVTGSVGPAGFNGRAIDYDAYWNDRHPGSLHPRFLLIEAGMPHGARVLDVGCGDGVLLGYLRERKAIVPLGLDVSETGAAKARAAGLEVRVGTLDVVAGTGPYDAVIMSEVIEHVADAEGLLRQAWALTGGTLWLTFPNIAYFSHRLRLLFGRFPVQWAVFPGEHVRFWSLPDFREWLTGLGLPQAAILPSNGVTVLGLHRWWPNLFANQIVVRVDRRG